MKRCVAILAAVMMTALPVRAHTRADATEVAFEALPCAVVCAYWDVPDALGYAACENPFPPGTYDDVLTSPAPTPPPDRIVILEATMDPEVDWDAFLCESEPPYRELAQGANLDRHPCDNILGPNNAVPIGCHEDMSTLVRAGQTVIMRVYNWSDAFPAVGHYWFRVI